MNIIKSTNQYRIERMKRSESGTRNWHTQSVRLMWVMGLCLDCVFSLTQRDGGLEPQILQTDCDFLKQTL